MRANSVESGGEYLNGADVRSADVFTSRPLLSQGIRYEIQVIREYGFFVSELYLVTKTFGGEGFT
jgi:hypothetical protein